MSLEKDIMEQLKAAMKNKDQVALASLRAIKTAILKVKTESGASGELSKEDELKLLQREVKQRKEAAEQFIAQGAQDMADEELAQSEIIEQFLPEQMSEEEVTAVLKEIIIQVGAESLRDMRKVMDVATKQLAGKSDGKMISQITKSLLS
ncbi:MAG: GatB/YqeY domain-containing protein [Flavobacteriales bacterium]